MFLGGFHNFFNVAALSVCWCNTIFAIRKCDGSIIEQIHDNLDARIESVNVSRLVVDWEDLENDPANPNAAHARSIT